MGGHPEGAAMLSRVGLQVVSVRADGSCGPRAASQLLFGHEDHHAQIRAAIVSEINDRRASLAPFFFDEANGLSNDVLWTRKLQHLGDSASWWDHMQWQVFGDVFSATIVFISVCTGSVLVHNVFNNATLAKHVNEVVSKDFVDVLPTDCWIVLYTNETNSAGAPGHFDVLERSTWPNALRRASEALRKAEEWLATKIPREPEAEWLTQRRPSKRLPKDFFSPPDVASPAAVKSILCAPEDSSPRLTRNTERAGTYVPTRASTSSPQIEAIRSQIINGRRHLESLFEDTPANSSIRLCALVTDEIRSGKIVPADEPSLKNALSKTRRAIQLVRQASRPEGVPRRNKTSHPPKSVTPRKARAKDLLLAVKEAMVESQIARSEYLENLQAAALDSTLGSTGHEYALRARVAESKCALDKAEARVDLLNSEYSQLSGLRSWPPDFDVEAFTEEWNRTPVSPHRVSKELHARRRKKAQTTIDDEAEKALHSGCKVLKCAESRCGCCCGEGGRVAAVFEAGCDESNGGNGGSSFCENGTCDDSCGFGDSKNSVDGSISDSGGDSGTDLGAECCNEGSDDSENPSGSDVVGGDIQPGCQPDVEEIPDVTCFRQRSRRGGIGQSAVLDEAELMSSGLPAGDWPGLWVTLPTGDSGLVVAIGHRFSSSKRHQPSPKIQLLVCLPRDGNTSFQHIVPWKNGQPPLKIMAGSRRELVSPKPPSRGSNGQFKGVAYSGGGKAPDDPLFAQALVRFKGADFIIHQEVVRSCGQVSAPLQRLEAGRKAACALATMRDFMDRLESCSRSQSVAFGYRKPDVQAGRDCSFLDRLRSREAPPHLVGTAVYAGSVSPLVQPEGIHGRSEGYSSLRGAVGGNGSLPVDSRQASGASPFNNASGARPARSQEGRARAALSGAPSVAQVDYIKALSATRDGLLVEVLVLTTAPFNRLDSSLWGSAWIAFHGGVILRRGSCSAITTNVFEAFLAAMQEAMLGTIHFLRNLNISLDRTRIDLSFRMARTTRGANPHTDVSAEAYAAYYSALCGGFGFVQGLTLQYEHSDAPFCEGCCREVVTDLRASAVGAANGLRSDISGGRYGHAIDAGGLPGAGAVSLATSGSISALGDFSARSLHCAAVSGTYAALLVELYRTRDQDIHGPNQGDLLLFVLASSKSRSANSNSGLRLLTQWHAELEGVELARMRLQYRDCDRVNVPLVAGDLVGAMFRNNSETCFHLASDGPLLSVREGLALVAKHVFQSTTSHYGTLKDFSLGRRRCPGQGAAQTISRLEGVTLATVLGHTVDILKPVPGSRNALQSTPYEPVRFSEDFLGLVMKLRSLAPRPVLGSSSRAVVERSFQGFLSVEVGVLLRSEAVGESYRADVATPAPSLNGAVSTPVGRADTVQQTNPTEVCFLCAGITQAELFLLPCCQRALCMVCASSIVGRERSSCESSRGLGASSGGFQHRRTHPLKCPSCNKRNRFPVSRDPSAVHDLMAVAAEPTLTLPVASPGPSPAALTMPLEPLELTTEALPASHTVVLEAAMESPTLNSVPGLGIPMDSTGGCDPPPEFINQPPDDIPPEPAQVPTPLVQVLIGAADLRGTLEAPAEAQQFTLDRRVGTEALLVDGLEGTPPYQTQIETQPEVHLAEDQPLAVATDQQTAAEAPSTVQRSVLPLAFVPPQEDTGLLTGLNYANTQFSLLYCAVLNYASFQVMSSSSELRSVLERSVQPFAPEDHQLIADLLRSGRHLFRRHMDVLETWRSSSHATVDYPLGYGNSVLQEATRDRLERAGGSDIRDFWENRFDLVGPGLLGRARMPRSPGSPHTGIFAPRVHTTRQSPLPQPQRTFGGQLVAALRTTGTGQQNFRGGAQHGGRVEDRAGNRYESGRHHQSESYVQQSARNGFNSQGNNDGAHTDSRTQQRPSSSLPPRHVSAQRPPLDPTEAAHLVELRRPDHPMWLFIRQLPIERVIRCPRCIPKKHLEKGSFVLQLERAIRVASSRCNAIDVDRDADAHKLLSCIHWVIFGKHGSSSRVARTGTPWIEVVIERVDRLLHGHFAALFEEASAVSDVPPGLQTGRDDASALRAVRLAHQGRVSKALGALASGGILPMDEPAVQEAMSALLQTGASEAPLRWQDFVHANGRADTDDAFKFVLGESELPGTSGEVEKFDTLEYALSHCDISSAAGFSGISNYAIRRMDPDTLRPLLRVYFGQGIWDYTRRLIDAPGDAFYHADVHALLISSRGIALDKDGSGFTRGQPVCNARPICIGETLRRLAAQCQLLQLNKSVGDSLAKNGQYGAGFKCGTDTVYHFVAKIMDAFVANRVAGGASQSDARNAFCSIRRRAIQRGIFKHAPVLMAAFDFLYGPQASGSCYYFTPGRAQHVGSCLLVEGVQQGDVFGPLFFSLGLDELLTAVREHMRDLKVDSTMISQRVHIVDSVRGTLVPTGGEVLVPPNVSLTLLDAPPFTLLETLDEAASGLQSVFVRVGSDSVESSFVARIPWQSVRLRAEVSMVAYLDDITGCTEAHLLRPFNHALRVLGPIVGLHFDSLDKNYTYVPRCFADSLRTMYPDAVFIDDSTPGSSPKEQLAYGARHLNQGSRSLLISFVGIPKLMGAPLRALCPDESLHTDRSWVSSQAQRRAEEVIKLFAHLSLEAVDSVGLDQLGDAFATYKDHASKLPTSELQIKMFIARYCLGTRLNFLSRSLPSSLSRPALSRVDRLLQATVAGCAGLRDVADVTEVVQKRSLLAMRFGGALPGSVTIAPASYVCAVGSVERILTSLGSDFERVGTVPPAFILVKQRIVARAGDNGALLTPLEQELAADVTAINVASASPSFRDLMAASTRGRRRQGPDANATGLDRAIGDDAPPAPPMVALRDLAASAGNSRNMADALWSVEFFDAYAAASLRERLKMIEGLSKGAGLALLAIPMANPFIFTEAQFRRTLTNFLGLDGGLPDPWTHFCAAGRVRTLTAATLNHLEVCSCLGRNSAPHNAVRDLLKHFLELLGVTDAAMTEVPVRAPNGETLNTDVIYFDRSSGKRHILEVSIVSVNSDTSAATSSRRELDAVHELTRAREEAKSNNSTIRSILDEQGNNTIFTPIVMTASGGMGQSMVNFLRKVYNDANEAGVAWQMEDQRGVEFTWNTGVASTYWDMRFSVACAVTDAHFQNRLIQRDLTLSLPVVARQPHPDINHAAYRSGQPRVGWAA